MCSSVNVDTCVHAIVYVRKYLCACVCKVEDAIVYVRKCLCVYKVDTCADAIVYVRKYLCVCVCLPSNGVYVHTYMYVITYMHMRVFFFI